MEYEKLAANTTGEPSSAIRERVGNARDVQAARFAGTHLLNNAEMTPTEVRKHCQSVLDEKAQSLLKLAMTQLSLSARAFHRVLKLARTIADMANAERIASPHVAEAVQYRHRLRA